MNDGSTDNTSDLMAEYCLRWGEFI